MQSLAVPQKQGWLLWLLKGLLVLGLVILLGRLIELQIIKGNYFLSLAEGNRMHHILIAAPRGEILARGGEILVGNREVKKEGEIITEWVREYLLGADLAHVSGYLGQVDQDEAGKVNPNCLQKGFYHLNSLIGKSGLEKEYECRLRGIDGEELIEVDAQGKKVRFLGRKMPTKGENIKTTIDIGLQRKIASLMQGKKGAIIVSDPRGEILALYSSPSFDPDNPSFSLDDPDLPFFNRTLAGIYHPGSIFKIVTATAALEEGKIDKNFTYEDPGVIEVNRFAYTNWYFTQYGKTEGVIDLKRAIARSTDTFFYKLGEFVGATKLAEWAAVFGLDSKTGIDLPGEVEGLIPTPEWKKRVKKEAWFLGNTYHMAIGQGDIAVTPLAANMMVSVIANNGELCEPQVVFTKENCQKLPIELGTIEEIKKGMIGACSQEGTATPFFDFVIGDSQKKNQVACKTGTAETEEEGKTHAWFVAFAPVDLPEIVITVLVEKGGEGSLVAAPIAREILDYYFNP